MPGFFVALVILVGGYWVLRQAGQMQPAQVRTLAQKLGGAALLLFALLLALRGNMALAVPAFVLGSGLLGFSSYFPSGFWRGKQQQSSEGSSQTPVRKSMGEAEALSVLGLRPGATDDEIKAAHRRLLKGAHPDVGGTDYLAAKINQAKDVLLGRD